MNGQCILSDVAKDYAMVFYKILDDMVSEMRSAELSDSISYNFIVQMIPHHRAAIKMSENILKYTTCVTLQNIAKGIVEEQTESIANMEEIKENCLACKNDSRDITIYGRKVGNIMEKMFCGMERANINNNLTTTFIREMIPHHMGAVEMSKNALSFDICCPLIPILNAIISSQEKGIAQMQSLLRRI